MSVRAMVVGLAVLVGFDMSARAYGFVERDGDVWVVDVPAGECARPTVQDFAATAGEAVHKRGAGRLALTRTAARDLDLVYENGALELVCAQEVAEDWYYRSETAIRVDNEVQSIQTETADPFELGEGSLAVGINAGWGSAVTSRKVPVRIDGGLSISGRVRMSGTGAWGLAVVLHNDPRGYEAKGTQSATEGLCYASASDSIRKSFAVGFVNYVTAGYFGRYKIGRDGSWTETATTDPMIYFNTADTTVTPAESHDRVFDFALVSDPDAKTVTLTLTQEQNGSDVVFSRMLQNTDLVEICGGDTAYLAFTTDSGGRTTYGTVSNLEIDDGQGDAFLDSLVVTTPSPEIRIASCASLATNRLAKSVSFTASRTDVQFINLDRQDQTLSLGACATLGDVSFAGLPPAVSAASDATNSLWHYDRFNSDNFSVAAASETPYLQKEDGTVGLRVGSEYGNSITLTARKAPVPIVGRMKVSGRATMSGSGAWGFALVLHNDPRGFSACGDWYSNSDLGYHSATNASASITNSLAVGFLNYHMTDHLGQYRFGRNGKWEDDFDRKDPDSRYITDPMIYFNTWTGEKDADGSEIRVTRVFDFSLESDTAANTVTLTLTQEQDGEPVTFVRTWTDADLVDICGSETAYLAFTATSGGRTSQIAVNDLAVLYSSDSGIRIETDGVLTQPAGSSLAFDAVDFRIDRADKVANAKRVSLFRGAALQVERDVTAVVRSVMPMPGLTVRRGAWTARDCDWVEGDGSVSLGFGMRLIVR